MTNHNMLFLDAYKVGEALAKRDADIAELADELGVNRRSLSFALYNGEHRHAVNPEIAAGIAEKTGLPLEEITMTQEAYQCILNGADCPCRHCMYGAIEDRNCRCKWYRVWFGKQWDKARKAFLRRAGVML